MTLPEYFATFKLPPVDVIVSFNLSPLVLQNQAMHEMKSNYLHSLHSNFWLHISNQKLMRMTLDSAFLLTLWSSEALSEFDSFVHSSPLLTALQLFSILFFRTFNPFDKLILKSSESYYPKYSNLFLVLHFCNSYYLSR